MSRRIISVIPANRGTQVLMPLISPPSVEDSHHPRAKRTQWMSHSAMEIFGVGYLGEGYVATATVFDDSQIIGTGFDP